MKKRKLKKKIKKLEKKVEIYRNNLSELITRIDISLTKKITNLSDAYTNRFNKFNPDDIKTINNRIDGVLMDTNYLRRSIQEISGRCDILDRRTQTDYDKIIPKEAKPDDPKLQRRCTWCKYCANDSVDSVDSVLKNGRLYYKCNYSGECTNYDKFEMREGSI